MRYNQLMIMQENLDNFWENKEALEKRIEKLKEVFESEKLPEELLNPQRAEDSEEVTSFANAIYELGCEISDLGEKFGVGQLVEDAWNEKSGYTSYRAKLNDLGHKESDF